MRGKRYWEPEYLEGLKFKFPLIKRDFSKDQVIDFLRKKWDFWYNDIEMLESDDYGIFGGL